MIVKEEEMALLKPYCMEVAATTGMRYDALLNYHIWNVLNLFQMLERGNQKSSSFDLEACYANASGRLLLFVKKKSGYPESLAFTKNLDYPYEGIMVRDGMIKPYPGKDLSKLDELIESLSREEKGSTGYEASVLLKRAKKLGRVAA